MSKPKIPAAKKAVRKSYLVYLVFCSNRCYTKVITKLPEGVILDLKEGTWSWRHFTHQIGQEHSRARNDGCPIIGVYNRNRIAHLSSMVRDSQEATSDDNSWLDD